MIQIGFEEGSVLVESGESIEAVPDAVRSACLKLSADVSSVKSIQCAEVEYSAAQIDQLRLFLALQDAIAALKQYANPGNWSGVYNRQRTVQRRWKGEGEGFELAQSVLDRLQQSERL